jgi:carboxymethylenebutenolidase
MKTATTLAFLAVMVVVAVSKSVGAATPVSAAARGDDARMAAAHAEDSPVPTPAATTSPVRETTLERVEYGRLDGRPLLGYLSRPVGVAQPLPGLIVIHEWWGLNDNVRDEARRLAAEGYVTLAVDLYDGAVATRVPEAMALSRQLTEKPAPAEDNLRQAYAYLDQAVRAPRIGVIGWCLGGRWTLRAALLHPEQVDAAVIYYGSVRAAEQELAALRMPILGLFGSKDPVVPLAMVTEFEETMRRLGRDLDIKVYEGAGHAFANPSGTTYQAEAAEDAWARTTDFLHRHLQAGPDAR